MIAVWVNLDTAVDSSQPWFQEEIFATGRISDPLQLVWCHDHVKDLNQDLVAKLHTHLSTGMKGLTVQKIYPESC